MKKFARAVLTIPVLAIPALASAQVPSSPTLGTAEGRCRPNESGPALLVSIVGLKDRTGTVKVELYPGNDPDFLQDDNILINAGKTFRRVVVELPKTGPVQVCIRTPGAGVYGLSLLHDRDGNRKFGLSIDGVGFGANPARLGPSKPRIAIGRVVSGAGPTPVVLRLLYRRGLFSFAPLVTS